MLERMAAKCGVIGFANGDLYFLSNRRSRAETTQARFRVNGKQPELWDAVTGAITPLPFWIDGEHTVIPLEFAADEALFVVFREETTLNGRKIAEVPVSPVLTLNGPWSVSFQEGRGAPPELTMDRLVALNEHSNPGVRYFSGVATYNAQFTIPADRPSGQTVWLDLGQVGDVARVKINGVSAGVTWFAPHRLDVRALVKEGENSLSVEVANLWVNRLIGDQQPGAEPVAYVTGPTYFPDAPLRPAGLIGPVSIQEARP